MYPVATMRPVSQPIFSFNQQMASLSPLEKLTTQIHHYIEQHSVDLSEAERADFASQCQQIFAELEARVVRHFPVAYHAPSQLAQGFYDRLTRVWDPHLSALVANPELLQCCRIFIAVAFNNVNEFKPEYLRELSGPLADTPEKKNAVQLALAQLEQAADYGDITAMVNLGLCYDYGTGVINDDAMAVTLYQQAVAQGNAAAMANLGLCFEHGRGVNSDILQAVALYQEAADLGCARALTHLGLCSEHGRGVPNDIGRAVALYQQAEDRGDIQACFHLGRCYFSGQVVKKNQRRAAELYQKASQQGCIEARVALGKCYLTGAGVNKEEEEAVSLFQQATALGSADAMVHLGTCYLEGTGVPKNTNSAVTLFQQAAELGSAAAKDKLGCCALTGTGVAKDVSRAAGLFQEAVNLGDAADILHLGTCYLYGNGVQQDFLRAAYHFQLASLAGIEQATQLLNSLYACDLVTPQQLEQADANSRDYPALMPFELVQAIKNKPGKMAEFDQWIQSNDINERYSRKEATLLMYSAHQNNLTTTEKLLQQGANLELVDRNYFTVFYNMDPELALLLLAHRPRVSRERIEAIINDCLQGYLPEKQHAKANLVLINHAVGLLVGVANIAMKLLKVKRTYLAHLLSMKGGDEVLEGMTPNDVCAIKIFHYLQFIMQLHHGQLSLEEIEPHELIRLLTSEIRVATELYKWEELSDYASTLPEKLPEVTKSAIKQAVVTNQIAHLGQLQDGEEVLYRTGYQNRDSKTDEVTSGHCIYVAFHRRGDELLIRIDNLWLPDIANRHRRSEQNTDNSVEVKYYPYLAQVIPMNQVAQLNDYVLGLFNARIKEPENALPLIYLPHDQLQIDQYQFPACRAQRVDNCTVKNYYVGELYRLGKVTLSQLRDEEKTLIIKTHRQHIPDQDEQQQQAKELPLRGGTVASSEPLPSPVQPGEIVQQANLLSLSAGEETWSDPLPSHEQVLQKMAACLKVSEQQMREGYLLQQTLVDQTGIKSYQTGSTIYRMRGGHTCFYLFLFKTDSYIFYDYYHARYPELIVRFKHLTKSLCRIIVDTRCLFDQVAPALGKQPTSCAIQ